MKQKFIERDRHRLVIAFAGWGSDDRLFSRLPCESSLLVCHDYGDLSFDAAFIEGYGEVSVFAWSLGVWAADNCLRGVRVSRALAYNGTPFPLSAAYGIAPEVFAGTIANFSEASLAKFRRRMCGRNLADFSEMLPAASSAELLSELESIYSKARLYQSVDHIAWTAAYYGEGDRIFLPGNQLAAWRLLGIEPQTAGREHFDFEQISRIFSLL